MHRQIFVIDVAGGDKVPRKGGPGVTRSDLLVINKTDLAPLVGADLGVMARDAAAVRGGRPVLFTSLAADPPAAEVAAWVRSVPVARARDWRVIARTTAVIEPGGVLGELSCAPPLTLRQVRGEDPGRCELRLVGTAAGPLPGRRPLASPAAASRAPGPRCAPPGPAWPRAGAAAGPRLVGRGLSWLSGRRLVADPGPLIVCQRQPGRRPASRSRWRRARRWSGAS